MPEENSTFGTEPKHLDQLMALGRKDREEEVVGPADPQIEGPGGQVGRYRLLRVLGEGGMGVVYLAEQTQPVRRQVAMKILKPGMDSKRVLARFQMEQQTLAIMQHPHVACVYDAGLAPSGRPYFVMEYVRGVPITVHCDQNRLTIEQRLGLFLHVCEAIQHAHQKGIIHRDIKPPNILVVDQDGEMIPKVIDFGIARALNQPLTERTLYTEQGQLMGTPEYMSPEQADPGAQDIDTRTDVYSLGVVLYELLAGVPPFDSRTFHAGGIEQVRKVLCEEIPKPPSTQLSRTSLEQSAELARRRQTDIRTLQHRLRGDLDRITLKALEKDRTRRYPTVEALAADIRRHLAHEPVMATGPNVLYCLGKFLRRRRSQVLVGLIMTGVISAVVAILALWNRDRLTLIEMNVFRDRTILLDARTALAQGNRELARKLIAYIRNSEYVGSEAQLLMAGILIEERRGQEAEAALKPLVHARPEIAGTAWALRARAILECPSLDAEGIKQAEAHRLKAEELLPATAEAYYLRAMTALTIPEKLKLLDEALRLDPGHYESRSLRALTRLASKKYDDLNDDALVMTILRPDRPLGHSLRATALKERGDCREALKSCEIAIDRAQGDDRQLVELTAQRCEILMRLGRYESALVCARELLRTRPDATVLEFHAFCALTALAHYDEASALFHRVCDSDPAAGDKLKGWSMQYVFNVLEAGRTWHPAESRPGGPAFLPMFEAQETYRGLPPTAHRLIRDCFTGRWSHDGSRIAFSLGVHGYSGVAVYDVQMREIDLLIVPGKDPSWSPDDKQIAFVRDCSILRLSEFTGAERRYQARPYPDEEIWVMNADGTEPRRLAVGVRWPTWSPDGTLLYCQSGVHHKLYSIAVADREAQPVPVLTTASVSFALSPDGRQIAHAERERRSLNIVDLERQTQVAEWATPFVLWPQDWSPDGREISLAGVTGRNDRTGVWIYDVEAGEGVRVLPGQIGSAFWSPRKPQLLFSLDAPYYELWVADLAPGLSTAQALGSAQTLEEHCRECIGAWNQELAVDPNLVERHWERATLALWTGDSQAPSYLQQLDRAVDRLAVPPYRFCGRTCSILRCPTVRDRLAPLAFLIASKAAGKDLGYATTFAPLFQAAGKQEEANYLWQMARGARNFLVNGGFEDGVHQPWDAVGNVTLHAVTELLDAAVAEKPIEGRYCLYVDVAPGAVADYWAAVGSCGAVFEAGKKYTISAFLKARKGALKVGFKPEQNVSGWPAFGQQTVTITDTWAEYHVTTPVFDEDVVPAHFAFLVGDAPGGFWIDDVRFYEGDYVPTIVRK